jgi:hypothetical protein
VRGGESLLERACELADESGRDFGPALVLKGDDPDRDDLCLRRARLKAQADEDQGDGQNDRRVAFVAHVRPHLSASSTIDYPARVPLVRHSPRAKRASGSETSSRRQHSA